MQTHERQCPSARFYLGRATMSQTGKSYFQKLPPWASHQMQAFLATITQKNSRIVWSKLRLLLLDPTKTLHCAVWSLVRKVHQTPGAGSRLLLEERRPPTRLAWQAKAARQAASSRVTLLDRCRVQSRLGQRDEIQGGQVDWLEFAPDFSSHTVTIRIPAKTAGAFKQDAQELLNTPMLPLGKLRRLAGKGGWIMNLLPKARWTIQRLWGAIAEEERRRISLEAGEARKHTRGGTRTRLIARRQVEYAGLLHFWGDQEEIFSVKPVRHQNPSFYSTRPHGVWEAS